MNKQLSQLKDLKEKGKKKQMFTPTPHFSVYTQYTVTSPSPSPSSPSSPSPLPSPSGTIYINFCSSPEVEPLLLSDQKTPAKGHEAMRDVVIPLSVGIIQRPSPSSPSPSVDVVMNPSIYTRCLSDLSFKYQVIEVCLQHIEEDHSLRLHRAYKENKDTFYGDIKAIAPQQKRGEQQNNKINKEKKTEILLPFSAAAAGEERSKANVPISLFPSGPSQSPKPLIEEIPSPSPPSSLGNPSALITNPSHTLTHSTTPSPHYQLDISLPPSLTSLKEVELEINSMGIYLNSPSLLTFSFNFPKPIEDDQATAKMIKSKHLLRITAPIKGE